MFSPVSFFVFTRRTTVEEKEQDRWTNCDVSPSDRAFQQDVGAEIDRSSTSVKHEDMQACFLYYDKCKDKRMAKVQSRFLSLKVIYIQIFDLILLKCYFHTTWVLLK